MAKNMKAIRVSKEYDIKYDSVLYRVDCLVKDGSEMLGADHTEFNIAVSVLRKYLLKEGISGDDLVELPKIESGHIGYVGVL